MKVSEYIVNYLIERNIHDVFGYPGGMVTDFMDSLSKRNQEISTHITFTEQAASFAACGYAQSCHNAGVAFATSGPGATNLITGIGNAYFDSIPVLFITGNVNSFESKGNKNIRQTGFQELDIVSCVKHITKKSFYVGDPNEIKNILDETFDLMLNNRKGPVLLDIPMNVMKAEISDLKDTYKVNPKEYDSAAFKNCLSELIKQSKRPCLVLGHGIKIDNRIEEVRGILKTLPIPVVSSLIACDIIPEDEGLEGVGYGFIGAYGNRTANFIVAKSDLVICIGTRLSVRQVGGKRSNFAPGAKIIRIDIDENELANVIRDDDITYLVPISHALRVLSEVLSKISPYTEWLDVCKEIKKQIKYVDVKKPNKILKVISDKTPDGYSVVADVGQNMIWTAQSFKFKPLQRAFFSGGMGSMGYALPAAIGVYYASHKPVCVFVGDGGLQMCIEELQFIKDNNIPIKIFVINNYALGMIRHFQEMYYNANYSFTISDKGYSVPDFQKIAQAYGIDSIAIDDGDALSKISIDNPMPQLFDIRIKENTYICPKLEFGKPNQDQEPLLDRDLYNYLMNL